MSKGSIAQRAMRNTMTVIFVVLLSGPVIAEAATARAAKDAGERSKAVAVATQYLQGQGFADPMISAENSGNALLTVEVDNRGWMRLSRNQRQDFLDKINGAALSANGGVAIDIQVSMTGVKVATSSFAAGQQVIRLLD